MVGTGESWKKTRPPNAVDTVDRAISDAFMILGSMDKRPFFRTGWVCTGPPQPPQFANATSIKIYQHQSSVSVLAEVRPTEFRSTITYELRPMPMCEAKVASCFKDRAKDLPKIL